MRLLFALMVVGSVCAAPAQETLYDINFSGPGQGVNQTVQTGAAPTQVTSIIYGDPRVVAAFGGLIDQPLHFDCAGNTYPASFFYDQIQLPIPRQYHSVLDLSFDFTSVGLIGSENYFAISIDNSVAGRVFWFGGGGEITEYFGNVENTLGHFVDEEAFRFGLHIDYDLDQWSVYKNGLPLADGFFDVGDDTLAIRLNFGPRNSRGFPDTGGAAIDNLLVQVPEPAFYGYCLVAGIALLGNRKWRLKRA